MLLLFQTPMKSTMTCFSRLSYLQHLLADTEDVIAVYSHILISMVAPFVLPIGPLSDRALPPS